MLRSRDWRTSEALAKLLRRDLRKLPEIRVHERRIGVQIRIHCQRRSAIPRTDILADVAPKNVASNALPHLFRNRATLLNREVCDTAGCIESLGSDKRLCRTRVDAPRAAATAVGRSFELVVVDEGG